MSVGRQTFFKLLLLLYLLSGSYESWHMIYVPMRKQMWNRFSKFCFKIYFFLFLANLRNFTLAASSLGLL